MNNRYSGRYRVYSYRIQPDSRFSLRKGLTRLFTHGNMLVHKLQFPVTKSLFNVIIPYR